ncbi:unnamed protein product [Lupinus luteus]|uniref:Protein kinase domain-containing protein n=1 Tax=Lupinus luteus TaxID=3873 RepID=A0AAV1WXC1_LUPLU
MSQILLILIIGIGIGFLVGLVLALSTLLCFKCGRKREQEEKCSSPRAVVPVGVRGVDSRTTSANSSNVGLESPRTSEWSNMPLWLERLRKKNVVSACGIPKYSYKDIQKATSNFTTIIGHGAFGSVYKAQMSTGETAAVKVLGTNSRQGEGEFLTEVLLLGRLHHRNLVGLVGYGAERGQHMLLYTYMSNGSLASHLHAMEGEGTVGWEEIVDSELNGKYDVNMLNDVASLALKCVNELSKSRPPMAEIAQELYQLHKERSKIHSRTSQELSWFSRKNHSRSRTFTESKEVCIDLDHLKVTDSKEGSSMEMHGLHTR